MIDDLDFDRSDVTVTAKLPPIVPGRLAFEILLLGAGLADASAEDRRPGARLAGAHGHVDALFRRLLAPSDFLPEFLPTSADPAAPNGTGAGREPAPVHNRTSARLSRRPLGVQAPPGFKSLPRR